MLSKVRVSLSVLRLRQLAQYTLTKCNSSNLSYKHNAGSTPLVPLTFGKLLEESNKKYGNREAVVSCHQNMRFTFSEVFTQANELAAGFQAIGLKKGDMVGIWAPNYAEWYITFLACARAGLVVVALNPAYEAQEVEYCINKVKIKAIICTDRFRKKDFYETLKIIAPEMSDCDAGKLKCAKVPSLEKIIRVSDQAMKGTFKYTDILNLSNPSRITDVEKLQEEIQIDESFNVQFTSGTTGKPKAAVVNHFGVVNNGLLVGKRNELDRKHHKICAQVPLFHAFGSVATISASINHGATLVLPAESHQPDKTLDAFIKEKCTILHGTPTMYVDLIAKQMERKENLNVEIAVTGGATLSPNLVHQMYDILNAKKINSIYGLSETTCVVFQSSPGDTRAQSALTVGRIHEHIEAKVVDFDGKIVPFGTPGELWIRGYSIMSGYFEDEAKTNEMITNQHWLKTGDQFILEADGYGKVVGRIKDMIIRGGENIYPKEIEDFLNTHPSVLDTAVVGLPHERLGEEVCACVRVKEGKSISLMEIKEYCKGKLAAFKVPSVLEIVDAFPTTQSGKIQKFKLIKIISNSD